MIRDQRPEGFLELNLKEEKDMVKEATQGFCSTGRGRI
jgi:hypothetical protein